MYSFHKSANITIKHSLLGILTPHSEPAVYIKGNTEPIKIETVDNVEEHFHCCGPDRRQALSAFPMPYSPHSLTQSWSRRGHSLGLEGAQSGWEGAQPSSEEAQPGKCVAFPSCQSAPPLTPEIPCFGRRWYCQHPSLSLSLYTWPNLVNTPSS